mgnify:CR=1 FL=1
MTSPGSDLTLWYDKPATEWVEALPIGNGRLGAMVFGVVPLVIASGAGAAGRQAMGIVIFTGMAIGTLFTLFVVPAMYLFLATDRSKQRAPRGSDAASLAPADEAPRTA